MSRALFWVGVCCFACAAAPVREEPVRPIPLDLVYTTSNQKGLRRATHAMSLASVTAHKRSSDGPASRSGAASGGPVNVSPWGSSRPWSSGMKGRKPSGPSLPMGTEAPAAGS